MVDHPALAGVDELVGAARELHELVEDLQSHVATDDRLRSTELVDRVIDEIWSDGEVFPTAVAAVPVLCTLLKQDASWLHPKLLLVLGVLVEATSDNPDIARDVHHQIGSRLDLYLSLASRARHDDSLKLALIYLLAHFPENRTKIEVGLEMIPMTNDDRARIDRCLTIPDFSQDETFALIGHSWPTPAIWELTAEENLIDASWRQSLDLNDDEAAQVWDLETKAILAYLGAQAEHAIGGTS
ncbi:hypothetical protein [Mycolicibacterium sp. XJ870]